MPALDDALQEFLEVDLTNRMVRAVLGAVPYAPPFPWIGSVADAVLAIEPDAPEELLARAERHAQEDADLQELLWMSRLLDASDRDRSFATGLFRAIRNAQRGGAAAPDPEQRDDAVLKALGIAFLTHRAFDGTPEQRVDALRASSAGQALSVYYAAVEVALPLPAAPDLAELFGAHGVAQASRLASMAAGRSIQGAQALLRFLAAPLQRVVDHARDYNGQVTQAAAPFVPGLMSGPDAEAVAGAADAMPAYRLLGARLAADVAARRALAAVG